MAEILGTSINTPSINFTSFFAVSWVWVFIIIIIGLILIIGLSIFLFFKTYNRKVIIFENLAGLGYRPVMKTRARIIKIGMGGFEILKTFAGGILLSADGRKMGDKTYWFCKESDGCYYNVILGDFDSSSGMLDIEPVDRDVRMFHVGLDRLSEQKHGRKPSFLEKHGNQLIAVVFLCVLVFGMWILIGRIGEATQSLASTSDTNREVAETLRDVLKGTNNIKTISESAPISTSGLSDAGE